MSQTDPTLEIPTAKIIVRNVAAFAFYVAMFVFRCALFVTKTVLNTEDKRIHNKELYLPIDGILEIITITTYGLGAFKRDWLLAGWVPLKLLPFLISDFLSIMAINYFLKPDAAATHIKFMTLDVSVYLVLAFWKKSRPYYNIPSHEYCLPPIYREFENYLIYFDDSVKNEDVAAVVEWLKERNIWVGEIDMDPLNCFIQADLNYAVGRVLNACIILLTF